MGTRHADRLWLYGGVAGAVLLLVVGWFLAIGPMHTEADGLRVQADDTETQIVSLRRRLAELQAQDAKLATYRAALKANQEALPAGTGVPDFLRQLQESGDSVRVDVTSMNIGQPETNTAVPTIFDLPITINADGKAGDLERFLDQMQLVQPRAVLIESVGISSGEVGEKALSVSLRAFVTKSGAKTGAASATPSAGATN
jgi:Tfp pilus assembly protein PilO